MTANTPFELILELLTPFSMRYPVTLDALLSAAVFNKTGLMGKDTIEHIPLAMEKRIFKGSSLQLPRIWQYSPVCRIMGLRGEGDLSPAAFAPKRAGRYVFIDQQRGDYKRNLYSHQGIQAKEVRFFGVGDPEKTVALIQHYIPGLGKRTNGGAGEIVGVHWLPTEEDYSWVLPDGSPARPLPVAIWQEIGGDPSAPVAPAPVTLPYWESPKVDAVSPPLVR